MTWFIDDLDEYQIYISNGIQEYYVPKFRLHMQVEEPYLYIYYSLSEQGDNDARKMVPPINYLDVADGYSGYVDNPSSAQALKDDITAMITSAWSTSPGGSILTAKSQLLGHDGVSDVIITGGPNEWLLIRDNAAASGYSFIAKTGVYSDAMAIAAVGEYSYLLASSGNIDAPNAASTVLLSVLIPGGTLVAGDSIRVTYAFKHSSGSGSTGFLVYLNDNATTVGATAYQTIGITGTLIWQCEAHIIITGATAQTGVINNGAVYQTAGGDRTTSSYNIGSDMYVNFVCTKATITDGAHLRWAKVIIEKYRV